MLNKEDNGFYVILDFEGDFSNSQLEVIKEPMKFTTVNSSKYIYKVRFKDYKKLNNHK